MISMLDSHTSLGMSKTPIKDQGESNPYDMFAWNPKQVSSSKASDTAGKFILKPQNLKSKHDNMRNGPLPLIKGNHSLIPDMKFGWRPKIAKGAPPIPLYFDFLEHPFWEYKDDDIILYNGFRPKTSFELHENYSSKANPYAYSYTFPQHYKLGSYSYEGAYSKLSRFCDNDEWRDFVGMNPKASQDEVIFDSKFESGNLDLVIKSSEKENYYNWFMRADSNSGGHLHWFYFSVNNAPNGNTL